MSERAIKASEFKARCLALLDEVASTRSSIVVTKRGVPVARVVPLGEEIPTLGSVVLLAEDDAAYYSTGESWDAD